jgi:hypothetical protein
VEHNFDRKAEDFGNIIALEHVNLAVTDQRLAILFYITGMGFTRDPYLTTGVVNMWVNIGKSQVHLPTLGTQAIRGHTGLVVPDLKSLVERLEVVRGDLAETKFDFSAGKDRVDVVCPWGNEYRVYAPSPQFGPIRLGMPYVEFKVPVGTAEGIGRFYRDLFEAPTEIEENNGTRAARVSVGYYQDLVFRETDESLPVYDGHHIQIYLNNFSRPYARFRDRNLISMETGQYEYRTIDIVDPENGNKLYELEHEIRSMSHPLFGRPFINRNPDQSNRNFVPGYGDTPWAQPYE